MAAGAAEQAGLARRVVTTVELRGQRDVDSAFADSDAEGIYRLLATRGVIADEKAASPGKFAGVAAPIDNVEMISMPRAGAILFHVEPGQTVEKGARLATIVHSPGEPDGAVEVHAPQAGYILTRSMAPLRPRRRRHHQADWRNPQRQAEGRRAGRLVRMQKGPELAPRAFLIKLQGLSDHEEPVRDQHDRERRRRASDRAACPPSSRHRSALLRCRGRRACAPGNLPPSWT